MKFEEYFSRSLKVVNDAFETAPQELKLFLVDFLRNLTTINDENFYSKTYLDNVVIFLLSLRNLDRDIAEIKKVSEDILKTVGEDYQKILVPSREGLLSLLNEDITSININNVVEILSNGDIDYKIKKLISKGFVPPFSFPFLWIGRLIYNRYLDEILKSSQSLDTHEYIHVLNFIGDVDPVYVTQEDFDNILPSILNLYDSLEKNKNIVKSYTSLLDKLIKYDFYMYYKVIINSKFNSDKVMYGLYSIVSALLVYYYRQNMEFNMEHPLLDYLNTTPSEEDIKLIKKKVYDYFDNKTPEALDSLFFDFFKLSLQYKKFLVDHNFERNLPIHLLELCIPYKMPKNNNKPPNPPNFYI